MFENVDLAEPLVADNIVTGQTTGLSVVSSVITMTPDYNNFWDNDTDLDGVVDGLNLFVDPRFISRLGSDAYPRHNSPTIGAGSNFTGWETETDRWGRLYVTDDLGCYARRVRPQRWGIPGPGK